MRVGLRWLIVGALSLSLVLLVVDFGADAESISATFVDGGVASVRADAATAIGVPSAELLPSQVPTDLLSDAGWLVTGMVLSNTKLVGRANVESRTILNAAVVEARGKSLSANGRRSYLAVEDSTSAAVVADSAGRFSMTVPSKPQRITAYHSNACGSVDVFEPSDVRIELTSQPSVDWRVFDASTKALILDFSVGRLSAMEGLKSDSPCRESSAVFAVWSALYAPKIVGVSCETAVDCIVGVALERRVEFAIEVVDEVDRPVVGALVSAETSMPAASSSSCVTDERGACILRRVSRRGVPVIAYKDGFCRSSDSVRPGSARIVLSAGGSSCENVSGTGISVLRMRGAVVVESIEPGSPAELAGVEMNDTLLAVDGVDVRSLTLDEVRAALRGPKGSSVIVELHRPFRGVASVQLVRSRMSFGSDL